MPNKTVLTGKIPNELEEIVKATGEPVYRARQLMKWIYQNPVGSFSEMSDLPITFRMKLEKDLTLHCLKMEDEVRGRDGTVKMLFSLSDGLTIETALMHYAAGEGRGRQTICVSTQAGCAIGCPFCATGRQGLQRSLSAGEIIDQVLYFTRRSHGDEMEERGGNRPGRPTNIVFMGMGEPLMNYDELMKAIKLLNSPDGYGLGARNITISTAGLVPQIERLSRENLQVGLAVSLHASDNKLRDRLVPINQKYPLEQLIPACREYFLETGRRPSFEYVLFQGINDTTAQAQSLAATLRGMNCHVNLIAANDTGDRTYRPPSREVILTFERELREAGINTTLRQSRGRDINAGCGQLRSRREKTIKENLENHRKKETANDVRRR
jgi:23S rRNA (adenine2503-C2)-methyltransferase